MAGLLAGVRVVDLTEPHLHMAGRILADLGAEVVLVEPSAGATSRRDEPGGPGGTGLRFLTWNAGKVSVIPAAPDDPRLPDLLAGADVVLTTRVPDETLGPARAPGAAWVVVTPFGLTGPRAGWRGSDLTIVAGGGGMYPTGDPDRPPLRCTEPASVAHAGPEAVVAALTALASRVPQLVDVSVQEALLVTSMTGPARWPQDRDPGKRRGVFTGRTRETWRCKDGWVSFGLRGGGARVKNLQTLTKLCVDDGVATPTVTERDWTTYSPKTLDAAELDAISAVVAAYFARHTMSELYAVAVRTGLMLAPANSAAELLTSEQLAARGFFGPLGDLPTAPQAFIQARELGAADVDRSLVGPRGGAPAAGAGPWPDWPARAAQADQIDQTGGPARLAWAGTTIVEFGSGAAGPISTRYFADHGASVVRVESTTRPDFLRLYAMGPGNPHGLEGSVMFAGLNAGKLGVTLDMKHPRGVDIARRLITRADAVTENFAPGAMARWGLGPAELAALRPDLVLVSACLQGQTGPHRDYPGFGGQGAALSGYTNLTGWPDRAPVGPAGTITDSLAPRFAAAALAAALLYRRRTGRGVHLDLSQVEAAAWTLSPWLADQALHGHSAQRSGNRHPNACPHGVFPCAGEDRWVALAIWDDGEWARLAKLLDVDGPDFATLAGRQSRTDDVESLVAAWTGARGMVEVAEVLQAEGLDAYPVNDWGDLHGDPQLAARAHFVPLVHPVLGEHCYEENGFRLAATPGGVRCPAPTLGQHNAVVLGDLLGLTGAQIDELAADGALR